MIAVRREDRHWNMSMQNYKKNIPLIQIKKLVQNLFDFKVRRIRL